MASDHDWFPLEEELQRLEREVPGVGRAAAGYRGMVERLTGKGPGLSPSELATLYDVSVPLDRYVEIAVEPERESAVLEASPDGKSFHEPVPPARPQDNSPGQR